MTQTRNSQAKRKRRAANRPAAEPDGMDELRRRLARMERIQRGETVAPSTEEAPEPTRRQRRRQRGRIPSDDPAHALRRELAERLYRLAQSHGKSG